jgi:hypothetical protein
MIGIIVAILAVSVVKDCFEEVIRHPRRRQTIVLCTISSRANTPMALALLPGWASLRGFG